MRSSVGLAAIKVAFLSCSFVSATWLPIETAAANEVTEWNVILAEGS